MRVLAILTVRNEAAFLLDWLAHHRAAGVTDFLVFSNDCQDGTDAMLDRLAEMGELTHLRNDGPHDKGGIQFTALKRADKLEIVKQADWILPLDVDEFVNIHVGDRTIPALLDALPEATAITLTWRLFGNAGVVEYEDRPVPHVFTRTAPVVMYWPWRSAMFKTLYRNDGTYRKVGVHRPRNPDPDRVGAARWFDGEGRELGDQFRRRRIFSNYGRSNYALAQLNHYPLGAMQSYVLKADRGRAVHSDHLLGLDYWIERNFNTQEDTSIRALDDRVAPIRTRLGEDPVLARLHAEAVAWRHARFEALMDEEPYRALFGRLLMTPPSRPLPFPVARQLLRYAQRSAPD
ncbi:glycosyltransferase family 2 protein [Marinibacterium profundimaris]|uniref:Glycosyl transferase family 2 n=1 Tax=Marinibacterium profundimaris TaxID=1679460 RepID=A0A225NSP0_9RHOB|nr:glycosyltransferase family 2 protein [Marinibacterium profundimaris]OWU77855.1 glycosyl transferase family 2 [Marinibacterium profundimaris]